MSDKAGLRRAYNEPSGLYKHGNVLHVAGAKSLSDAWDDLKLPLIKTSLTQRYKDANEVLKHNPGITAISGHSLGGAVALELQKENPKLQVTTYGAPVVSFTQSENRFRNLGDPISGLDFGTNTVRDTRGSLNPLTAHGYQNFNNVTETN